MFAMMTELKDAFAKFAVTLVTAAVLGTFAYVVNLRSQISELRENQIRIEGEIAYSKILQGEFRGEIQDLQHDVRALMIAVAKPEDPIIVPTSTLTASQRRRLEEIEADIQRQNCFLAGGPNRVPKPPACL